MIQITLNIPEELSLRFRPLETQLPRILERGLRELKETSQLS